MRDTNDSWLQGWGQQGLLSLKTKEKNKLEEEVPRFALLEEAIDDFMGKQDLGTRAKTDKDVSLLKKAFFQRKVELRKVKNSIYRLTQWIAKRGRSRWLRGYVTTMDDC